MASFLVAAYKNTGCEDLLSVVPGTRNEPHHGFEDSSDGLRFVFGTLRCDQRQAVDHTRLLQDCLVRSEEILLN